MGSAVNDTSKDTVYIATLESWMYDSKLGNEMILWGFHIYS